MFQKTMLRSVVTLAVFLACIPGLCWEFPYGERIRDLTGIVTEQLDELAKDGVCKNFGKPARLARGKCFECLGNGIKEDARQLMEKVKNYSNETIRTIRDPGFSKRMTDKIFDLKRRLQENCQRDTNMERMGRRKMIEILGNYKFGKENKAAGDYIRETIQKYLPALEGSDWSSDPVRVISYMLVFDFKGFAREVHILIDSNGRPVTLQELIQQKTNLSEKKTTDLIEMVDDMRDIVHPEKSNDRLPAILDLMGRGIRIITEE